jgi:hypothetical protein
MSFNEYWQAEQQRRALERALAALPVGGDAAQAQFLDALKVAVLLMPVKELPEGMKRGDLLQQQAQVRVGLVQGSQRSGLFVPVFTREEHFLRSYPEDAPYLLVPFAVIARMALSANATGIVIDQSGPASAVVQASTLSVLLQGMGGKPAQPAAGTAQAEQGAPPWRLGPPPRVVTYREIVALHEWLARQEGVVQAFLFGLIRHDGRAALTVGLGALEPVEQSRLHELAQELAPILGPSGILLLDERLARLLSRQGGAIRFDLEADEGGE